MILLFFISKISNDQILFAEDVKKLNLIDDIMRFDDLLTKVISDNKPKGKSTATMRKRLELI